MNFLAANTTNHRRILMLVATSVVTITFSLVLYGYPITFRDFVFPPVVGLVVFEILFRTRKWLSLASLAVYIIVITLVSQILYAILYGISYGGSVNLLASLQFLFTEFPTNVYVLIESSLLTGIAYYLIKSYRNEGWIIPEAQPAGPSNEPVFVDEGPMTLSKWLNKNQQQVWGFVGWFVLASLIAPFSFGLITTPATVICLLAFGFSKQRKGIAGGMLVAVSLNFVVALVRGLQMNAWCFMPFYIDTGFF